MRAIAPRRSNFALAALLLLPFACTKDDGDGLLSLRIAADATNPPVAATKLVLTGAPGGISRTYAGPVQLVPGSPMLFQFPGLPASDTAVTLSVRTYAADGCQTGQNAQPITTTIKAGVETGPIDVILVATGPCLLDAGTADVLTNPGDVAIGNQGGAGGFAGGGGRTSVGSGGAGGGGTMPGPTGGAGGRVSGGTTTTPSGGGVAGTGGRTGSGGSGMGGVGTGGIGTSGGSGGNATGGTRTGSGGVGTGGAQPGTGGRVGTGGAGTGGAGTGGIIGTGGSGAGGLDCSAPMPTGGGTSRCGQNTQGTTAGLAWSLWSNSPSSAGCMTTYSTPAFSATWNNNGDLLARLGLEFGTSGKPYDQYASVKADVSFKKNGTAGAYSYIGIYGWSQNPCVEWYIIEDNFGSMPFTPFNSTEAGSASIDGETYKFFRNITNGTGGSRCGSVTQWNQFWSVRQTRRQCGTVTISEHFKAWKGAGMLLGSLLEVKVLVESGGGAGSIEFPIANVTASSASAD